MKKLRGRSNAVLAGVLVMGSVVLGSAARADALTTLACGSVISGTVTLANDVGPCTGDGIVIVRDGTKLNLNGHTVTGSNMTNISTTDQVGIRLVKVKGVVVQGPGIVSRFDAGVAVEGGQGNTVKGLEVRANIAHVLLTSDGLNPADPAYQDKLYALPCDFGDGIALNNSNANTITNNTATNNGPFSGISLVGASSNNVVSNNRSVENLVSNVQPDGTTSGPCGPFGATPTGQGRLHQDIGIRIEGPGATNNLVSGNTASGNQLEGISVHGNICPGNPIGIPATPPNARNVIRDNTANNNGFSDVVGGIEILQQGPDRIVCVAFNTTIERNTANGNARDGIMIGARGSHDNKIVGNRVNRNGRAGIYLRGPGVLPGAINNTILSNVGRGNAEFDGFDGNTSPPCDNNRWAYNSFSVVNQSCIR